MGIVDAGAGGSDGQDEGEDLGRAGFGAGAGRRAGFGREPTPGFNPVASASASESLGRRLEEMLRLPLTQVAETGTKTGAESVLAGRSRRPRADARDNRQRLLAAADMVFGAEGVGASLDGIAREAGVGRATLYRHFPSREALLTALHDNLLTSIETQARKLGERPEGLFELLAFYVEQITRRATLVDHWLTFAPDSALVLRARTRLLAVIEPMLARALAAGQCRSGITPIDMLVVLNMLTPRSTGRSGDERRVLARRALQLLLVGLRP